MPKAVYTATKGLFEQSDSGFAISAGVSHECVSVPTAAVLRIRIFDNKADVGGDEYAGLEDILITVGQRVYELDVDGDGAATGDVAIATNGVDNATTAHAIATLIADGINGDVSNAGVFAVADGATTDASGLGAGNESTSDYADVLVYSHKTGLQVPIATNGASTSIAVSQVVKVDGTARSFYGSFYLPAGRTEDDGDVESDSDLDVGTLEDGSSVGETVLLLNNSTNRDMAIASTFSGGASARLLPDSGVLLAWNGSAWATVKSYGTFS